MLFVTVWLGILELSTGKVTASNAGHDFPALGRKGGKFEILEDEHSPAMAVMGDLEFAQNEFVMKPGDSLFLYTDGVTDACDPDYQLYGEGRMTEALNANINDGAEDMLNAVKGDIDAFIRGAAQFDDITMIYLKYSGRTED